MTDESNEPKQDEEDADALRETQEGKGYGEDEGERDQSLDEE